MIETGKKVALIWFNTNLQLRDNESLIRAIAEYDEVIPFYCLQDQHLATIAFAFKKTGNTRLKFLKESLEQLEEDLREAGSGLVLLNGILEKEVFRFVKKYGAQSIYAEKAIAPEELSLQNRLSEALIPIKGKLKTFESRNLFHTLDLPFPITELPDVFTEFRKKTEPLVTVRKVFLKPEKITSPAIEAINLSFITINVKADPRLVLQSKGGSVSAHQRLQHFLYDNKAILTYKDTRNGLIGADYSSKFSAWLTLGCISPKEIYEEVKNFEQLYGANESTYWLIFELLWRDYFGFSMEKNPHRCFQKRVELISIVGFEKWIEGRTGEPFIDANMIELKLSGFMSNRGRQNVACYLCNYLKIDWRYDAAHFEQQLIDYDVSNNWGNWAYLAGVGNDPRSNRYFNINKQKMIYDAKGDFQKLWIG